MKVNLIKTLAVSAAIAATGSSAFAQIQYDQNVQGAFGNGDIQATLGQGDVGNENGGFAVITADGVQLGLRGKLDKQNIWPDNDNGIYTVPLGTGSSSTRASWNYEFSIYAPGGLGNYTFALLIDSNPTLATSFTTLNAILPDSGGSGTSSIVPSTTLSQNSENALFPIVGPAGYNPNINGDYLIELFATNNASGAVTEDQIEIQVGNVNLVPDASSTLPLLGAALTGLALVGRKIKSKI